MLNSISRLEETRPEQEWSNGTEIFGYSDFPEKREGVQESISNDERASSLYAHISRSSQVFSQYSLKLVEAYPLQ